MTPAASIVFSTKNRRDELRKAVASSIAQSGNVEVIVIDDGSTDGTSDMIRSEFPSVRLERFETSGGYMVRRNHGAKISLAPIVISIDDDAIFPSTRTIEQTLAEFADPRVGAVAIPYIDVLVNQDVRQRAPDDKAPYAIAEFRGTACAFRRELFFKLGGWREFLFHQTEEGDYCVRMLSAGYLVRAGNADPIHHLESPKRDLTRQITFNARNNLLFAWHNVPTSRLPIHMSGTVLKLLRHGLKIGYFKATIRGLSKAAADILHGRAKRGPMTLPVYRVHRWLRARGATPMPEVIARLDAALKA
jgi:GT2 family glycosyltransferase